MLKLPGFIFATEVYSHGCTVTDSLQSAVSLLEFKLVFFTDSAIFIATKIERCSSTHVYFHLVDYQKIITTGPTLTTITSHVKTKVVITETNMISFFQVRNI